MTVFFLSINNRTNKDTQTKSELAGVYLLSDLWNNENEGKPYICIVMTCMTALSKLMLHLCG